MAKQPHNGRSVKTSLIRSCYRTEAHLMGQTLFKKMKKNDLEFHNDSFQSCERKIKQKTNTKNLFHNLVISPASNH